MERCKIALQIYVHANANVYAARNDHEHLQYVSCAPQSVASPASVCHGAHAR